MVSKTKYQVLMDRDEYDDLQFNFNLAELLLQEIAEHPDCISNELETIIIDPVQHARGIVEGHRRCAVIAGRYFKERK